MPIPLAVAIPAAISALGIGAGAMQNRKNRKAQEAQNAADRQQQWDLYHTQRNDALADWQRNNEYNSPVQQMNRLRQAGLNPHLIYGKGAENTAVMARGATPQNTSQQAFKGDSSYIVNSLRTGMDTMATMMQNKKIQAETDNISKQGAIMDLQAANMAIKNSKDKFDYDQGVRLKDLAVERYIADLENVKANTQFTLDSNERAELANTSNIAKTTQDILESKMRTLKLKMENEMNPMVRAELQARIDNLIETLSNLKKEGTLKDLEAQMKQKQNEMLEDGIAPGSPTWQLTLYQLWKKLLNL